ncbi:hypothetical protein SteCoe_607 [Stentor coeruleus]|uniref:Mannosyltransferase n=1 Tax=Stentor coeruleus TaxID=5963 RepID=A0A1R2D3P4_9CILI|nr:hypothetical protein SteCoe_607 [Stentor coeruleus]
MIWLLSYRLLNSLLVRSYFSPDEYWQSLEVAHKLVFGYGELTWEWTDAALRSIIHPSLFAIFYYILSLFNIDTPWLIAYGPRLLQGLILTITDYFIYKVSGKLGLTISVFSWFIFYAGIRTYSNSIELVLNSLALYLQVQEKYRLWNLVVGISCMVRPTAIIIWIPSYVYYLYKKTWRFAIETCFIGYFLYSVFCISIQILLDYLYFGRLTVSFYNFAQFNFFTGQAEFYSKQPWHWVCSEGLPVVLLSLLPLFGFGVWKSLNDLKTYSLLFSLLVISSSAHKEYRFLLPYFPHMIYVMTQAKSLIKSKWFYAFIGLQIPVALFLSLYHQVGPLATMDFLMSQSPTKIGFFINCHGTPFYSHIHKDIPMDFLQCKPL